MRMVLLAVSIAIVACRSTAPKPVIENVAECRQPPQIGQPDATHPYYFAGACVAIPHRCNLGDCREWKVGHGTDGEKALEECIQECPCGD